MFLKYFQALLELFSEERIIKQQNDESYINLGETTSEREIYGR